MLLFVSIGSCMNIALGIEKQKASFAEVRPDGEAATSHGAAANGAAAAESSAVKRLMRAEHEVDAKASKEAQEHPASLRKAKEHWPSLENPTPQPVSVPVARPTSRVDLEDYRCAYGPWTEWSTCSGSCTDRMPLADGSTGPILTGTRRDGNGVAKPWQGNNAYSGLTPVRYSSRDAMGLWASYWYSTAFTATFSGTSGQLASFNNRISSFWTSKGSSPATVASNQPDMQRAESRVEYYISTGAWYNVGGTGIMQTQNYGVQWLGYLIVQIPGSYTFQIESHDGASLYVWQNTTVNAQAQALAHGLGTWHKFHTIPHGPPSGCSSPNCVYIANTSLAPVSDQTNLNAFNSGTGLPASSLANTASSAISVTGNSVFIDLRFFKGANSYTSMILRYSGPDTGNQLIPIPAGMLRHSPAYHLLAGTAGCTISQYSLGAVFNFTSAPGGTIADNTVYPNGGTRVNGYYRVDNCNTQPCPIDCTWTPWVPHTYTQCTAICGGGTKYRNRTTVKAQFGGQRCVGEWELSQFSDVQLCAMSGCPCPTNDCR